MTRLSRLSTSFFLSTRLFSKQHCFMSTSSVSRNHQHLTDDCIFCKIIRKEVPSFQLIETEKSYAFMDIEPLSDGHSLIIPKYHAKYMHELPDEYLADALPIAKKIAAAGGFSQYNVLQNNGPLANQAVPHVHFHVIPKPDKETGLGIRWNPLKKSKDDIKVMYDSIKERL
ncbi:HIT-like domain-containing protein [Cokeromyces recurvatus]|uniref:HIT-like domain-containing protein n=1 Tax=Cokeromyces recurvatus TaxID=90255 RepID=UPI00221F4B77|nr:HIT-like domain-containing protein [Cokeromyces recurvatus]KAI7907885.1 HIT-like domain-containing protein [Cokeromyces recurvatus]